MSTPSDTPAAAFPTSQFTLRALLVFIAVFACLCGGLVRMRDAFKGPEPGIVTERRELPASWSYAEEAADRAKVDLSGIEFYRISQGFDDDYMIRLDYTPERLQFFVKFRSFSPVTTPTWHIGRFWEYMPGGWTTRKDSWNVDFYICDGWLRGDEGDLYVMMYDKQAGKLYIWYHFNF